MGYASIGGQCGVGNMNNSDNAVTYDYYFMVRLGHLCHFGHV